MTRRLPVTSRNCPLLFGATIVDLHPNLSPPGARSLARGPPRPRGAAELGRVPLTAADSAAMSKDKWKDADFASNPSLKWQQQRRPIPPLAHLDPTMKITVSQPIKRFSARPPS